MSKTKSTPEGRLDNLIAEHGVDLLNQIVERHKLASEKRTWFTLRFGSEDPDEEKEYTKNMQQLDDKIRYIDNKILVLYKINDKNRTQILRDIKKVHPDGWMSGFAVD